MVKKNRNSYTTKNSHQFLMNKSSTMALKVLTSIRNNVLLDTLLIMASKNLLSRYLRSLLKLSLIEYHVKEGTSLFIDRQRDQGVIKGS